MISGRYDCVIVGSGIAGALIAKRLGSAGKRVLVIEAGEAIQPNINTYMERFYKATAKVPESPYPPDFVDSEGRLLDPGKIPAGRPTVLTLDGKSWKNPKQSYLIQKGSLAFASTYERIAGGTSRHWLGTCLRLVPNDFRMKSTYGKSDDWPSGLVDWPIGYSDLESWYCDAEAEIGVSADRKEQTYHGIEISRDYPMPALPKSRVDMAVANAIDGLTLEEGIRLTAEEVRGTPAARNSQPYQSRRVCAGNTNCIPICPIQAKYDPTITLNEAFNTGNVEIAYQTVANNVAVDENGRVTGIEYINYQDKGQLRRGSIQAKTFVIAANAIETPRLLLMSASRKGVANSKRNVGKYLMDHPLYLAWALMPQNSPIFPYRGPLSTSGIEITRDGAFRSTRAAFRIEIGNEGWNFPKDDPNVTTADFVTGSNDSGTNVSKQKLFGTALVQRLNSILTRQFRLGILVEQTPESTNTVSLATEEDGLGLPRPEIKYDLSDYTKRGFEAAKKAADDIFLKLGVEQQFTTEITSKNDDPCVFEWPKGSGKFIKFYGAGHIVGTCRMGSEPANSVVDSNLRCWDHPNLFIAGSSVFPTVATGNPTLTIAALSLRLAEHIKKELS
jgi:glucose dehydrogenase